jgi:hypothetical protein
LTGCDALLGDPDRVIALELVGSASRTMAVGDTLRLSVRAIRANGDSFPGAAAQWAILDTGFVGLSLDAATGQAIAGAPGKWRVQAGYEDLHTDPVTITVVPGPLDHFLVEAAGTGPIGSQTAGVAFAIRVVALDSSNATVAGFNGRVDISSTGTLAVGGGTTARFTHGVLANHGVAISNTGSFAITASLVGYPEQGSSNPFAVDAPPSPAAGLGRRGAAGDPRRDRGELGRPE